MKCSRCGKDYPSEYYFKTPALCLSCYDSLPAEEKARIDEDVARLQRQTALEPRRRSFAAVILLCVVTLGIYYLYWLYANLDELGILSAGEDLQRAVRRGKLFFFLYLAFIVVGVVFGLVMAIHSLDSTPEIRDLYPLLWVLLIPQVAIELALYYFFSLSIVRGLSFVCGAREPVARIYGWMVVVVALDILMAAMVPGFGWSDSRDIRVGSFIFLGLLSLGFLLTFLYRCQGSINRIWEGFSSTASGS